MECIDELGVENVKVADVAARAEVHETSIYRRWKTRPGLIVDALMSKTDGTVSVPDTGTLRGDLVKFAQDLAAFSSTPAGRAFNRGFDPSGDDMEIIEACRRFWQLRHESFRPVIERAQNRGEVRPDVDPLVVVRMLGSYVIFHSTYLGGNIHADAIDVAVEITMRGIVG